MLSRPFILAASIATVLLCGAPTSARAADGVWIQNANPAGATTNLWSDASNWLSGGIADGINANAFFVYNPTLNDIGANIVLDSSRTLGNLWFEDFDGVSSSSMAVANPAGVAAVLTLQTTVGVPTLDAGILLLQNGSGKKAILQSNVTGGGSLTLAGTQGFQKTGLGQISFRGIFTNTGPISVLGGLFDSRASLASASSLTVSGAGTVSADYTNFTATANLLPTGVLTLGGAAGSGFLNNTVKASTTNAQVFSGVNINAGANTITAVNAGAGFTSTYSLGNLSRNAGGALNLLTSGAGTSTFDFLTGGSVTGNDSSGILGGWAVFNNNDWARVNGNTLSAAGLTYTNNAWGPNLNTTILGANFPLAAGINSQADAVTHTLRFNDASARFLTLSGVNVIETGGILFGNNTNPMHQVLGGSVTPGAGVSDMVIQASSSAGGWGSIFNSDIVDNGAPVLLVKAGTGPLLLDGNKSFTGGVVIGQGTLVLGKALGGSATGSVLGNIVNSGTLAFNRSGTYTPANSISGNGNIAQWSDGNLVLTRSLSAGGLDLRNGTTTLDFNAAGAPASNFIPAGQLTANGNYTGGGRLILRDATLSLTGKAGAASTQFFAMTDLIGSASINLSAGAGGTLSLNLGAYTRPNNANDGGATLKASLPAGTSLLAGISFPGVANALVADNGQAFVTVNGTDWGAKDAANAQIIAGSAVAGFYSPLSLLSFGSNADFDADTTVSASTTLGSVRFHKAGAANLNVDAGMQLKAGGLLISAQSGATSIGGAGSLSAISTAGRDLPIFQNSAAPLTINAVIANTTAAAADITNLIKDGPGELILTAANTFSGKTYVQGGLLRLTAGNIGTAALASGSIFIREGEMRLEGSASVHTGGNFVSVGQRLGESGTLTLAGASTWITNGDFNVSDVNAAGTVNIRENAALTVLNLYAGKVGSGTGTINLSGGSLTVSTGGADIRIGGANPSDSIAQGIINQSGGTMTVPKNFQLGANGIGVYNQSGGTFVATGGFTGIGRFISGQGTWNISAGTFDLSAGTVGAALIVGEQGSGALNISGTGVVNAKSMTLGHNGGVGVVNQTGGTLTLSALGSVTFGTPFQTGLILAPQGAGASATFNLSGGVLTTQAISRGAGSGTFNFNGGTLKPLAFNANFMAGLTAAYVQAGGARIDTNGVDIDIAQLLGHDPALGATIDGGLTKDGLGTLALRDLNTYTGPTVVNAGGLVVSGSLSSSSSILVKALATLDIGGVPGGFNLAGGQRLGGGGSVLGDVTLASGSKIAPGDGAGTLSLGNNLNAAAVGADNAGAFVFELGTTSDKIVLGGGALSIGTGTLGFNDFAFTNSGGLIPGTYTLIDTSASIVGSLDGANRTGLFGGNFTGTLSLGDNGRDIVLTVAVPEPSTSLALLGGGALLLGLRRRQLKA